MRAVSVISRHGAGEKMAPTAAPPASWKRVLRVVVIMRLSFVAIQTTVSEAMLTVAVHAIVHLHAAFGAERGVGGRPSPDIAGVAADAVLLVGAQGIGGALVAVAGLALHAAQLDVRDVREGNILGLARIGEPLRVAVRRDVLRVEEQTSE